MRKIYSIMTIVAIGISTLFNPSSVKAQALEQGGKAFDVYYGFPNLTSYLIRAFVDDNGTNAKLSSLGPIGAKFEYMVSDKVGIGLEYNYTQFTVDWDETDSSGGVSYHYQAKSTLHRIFPRFNIHFGSSENFDGYFAIGAGYRSRTYSITTNDPNGGSSVPGLNPFAFRIALGGRYYFTENIGLLMELGLSGGALIHGGIAIKF